MELQLATGCGIGDSTALPQDLCYCPTNIANIALLLSRGLYTHLIYLLYSLKRPIEEELELQALRLRRARDALQGPSRTSLGVSRVRSSV
jgi:hypothetical protein